MPNPQPTSLPDTRSRIIEAARALFWEKGYAATGLAEILARGRANSGSFYHFFESKDALLATVLDSYVDLLEPHVIGPVWASTADPLARIEDSRRVETVILRGASIDPRRLLDDARSAGMGRAR